jgi:glycine/D-amino acid oxidase-like deaminating enzyme
MADEVGADLYDEVEAKRVEKQGAQFSVTTNKGVLIAENVLFATNGHTSNIKPWMKRRLIPAASYMIATEELPPDISQRLIPNNRMISDTKNILYYFRLSPDGRRMLFGGRAKIADAPMSTAAPILYKFMTGVYPQLEEYRIEYAWSGRVCFTFDRFPHIGSHEGIFYAVGYCGHGVGMAAYFGQKVAEMMLGSKDCTVFAEKRFRTVPFYSGNPWFLPLVHMYYRILDRIP